VQLTDALRSLVALELLVPSKQIYLISPWISDMPLLDNRFGQFRAIMPELGKVRMGLVDVLNTLAERGSKIWVMYRPQATGIAHVLHRLSPTIYRKEISHLHEKGLICDGFYLRGSMNFTYSGININEESIELTTEPSVVASALNEAKTMWETF
jgi:phosphatidylserine/phosphatidylglycerophosphate/cardiolipin synthase-like enzyme